MKIFNLTLQCLLTIAYATTLLLFQYDQVYLVYILLVMIFAGPIQLTGSIYHNIKSNFTHIGYAVHLALSVLYLGLAWYFVVYKDYFKADFSTLDFALVYITPFMLTCLYTWQVIKSNRKIEKVGSGFLEHLDFL